MVEAKNSRPEGFEKVVQTHKEIDSATQSIDVMGVIDAMNTVDALEAARAVVDAVDVLQLDPRNLADLTGWDEFR